MNDIMFYTPEDAYNDLLQNLLSKNYEPSDLSAILYIYPQFNKLVYKYAIGKDYNYNNKSIVASEMFRKYNCYTEEIIIEYDSYINEYKSYFAICSSEYIKNIDQIYLNNILNEFRTNTKYFEIYYHNFNNKKLAADGCFWDIDKFNNEIELINSLHKYLNHIEWRNHENNKIINKIKRLFGGNPY